MLRSRDVGDVTACRGHGCMSAAYHINTPSRTVILGSDWLVFNWSGSVELCRIQKLQLVADGGLSMHNGLQV